MNKKEDFLTTTWLWTIVAACLLGILLSEIALSAQLSATNPIVTSCGFNAIVHRGSTDTTFIIDVGKKWFDTGCTVGFAVSWRQAPVCSLLPDRTLLKQNNLWPRDTPIVTTRNFLYVNAYWFLKPVQSLSVVCFGYDPHRHLQIGER